MAMTIHFASKFHSAMDLIFPKPPKEPPDGIITSLIMILITWICILSHLFIACGRILRHNSKNNKRSKRRPKKKSGQTLQQFCIIHIALQISRAQQSKTSASKGSPKADDKIFHKNSAFSRLQIFTTSFVDVDVEKLNTQVTFNTDSIFFVCDNSTTGHICNDLLRFVPGSLQQITRRLTTSNDTGPPFQEGTIKINITDDDGKNTLFLLEGCIYNPDSSVNLLSTRRLAEKFLDADGNPDEETRIEPRISSHTLTWCFRRYKKTFSTPIYGLPELIFDKGFTKYKSFLAQVGSPIAKLGPATVEYGDEKIDTDNMLFMDNESIKFNDGNGTNDSAVYMGPVSHGYILKHKIRRYDNEEYLVDREHISSITVPEISNFPILIEEYAYKLHNLTTSQLKDISKPEILDKDKQDLVSLHDRMNHLPFPAMIKLAENGNIDKRFAKLKNRQPVYMSCVFGRSHRQPCRSKKTTCTIHKVRET